jgi:hypothetical protein
MTVVGREWKARVACTRFRCTAHCSRKRIATAERERDEYRALYIETLERCRKLERGLLASKSEHLPDNGAQLSLEVLDDRQRAQLEAALDAANAEQEVKGHTRRNRALSHQVIDDLFKGGRSRALAANSAGFANHDPDAAQRQMPSNDMGVGPLVGNG